MQFRFALPTCSMTSGVQGRRGDSGLERFGRSISQMRPGLSNPGPDQDVTSR
jgi:hypothetical protein